MSRRAEGRAGAPGSGHAAPAARAALQLEPPVAVSRFFLSKWYLDAVGEDGEVFIGYRAALRGRGLRIAYASVLTAGAGEVRTRSTVRPGKEPDFCEGGLAWAEPRLDVSAVWRGSAQPICRTLHEGPGGAVVWNCVLPSAECSFALDGNPVRGLGYAEHLSMTLPPWRLPIDTLRWGRFLAPEQSVVWIDWGSRGDAKTWVFVNGTEVRGDVSEEDVFFEGGRLRLPTGDRLVLRAGALSHLLRNLPLPLPPALRRRLPGIHETKWRTRGVLERAGAPPAGGWAIHEVVRFRP